MNKSNYKRYNTANVSGTSTLEGGTKVARKAMLRTLGTRPSHEKSGVVKLTLF